MYSIDHGDIIVTNVIDENVEFSKLIDHKRTNSYVNPTYRPD